MLPDTSAIGNALVATLGADAALLAIMPNGVYFGVAPAKSERFVIVRLRGAVDVPTFEGRSIEDGVYEIEAVGMQPPGTPLPDVRGAAHRIDQLLEDQPLVVAGYAWMATFREEPIREVNPDDLDPAVIWHHRGGAYRVQMTITGDAIGAESQPGAFAGVEP